LLRSSIRRLSELSGGGPAQASAAVPGAAGNYVPGAARLLTGLDLIIVFNDAGEGPMRPNRGC